VPSAPKKTFVVSHTHWDREWYLTYHEFRVDLVRVVKRVIDVLESDSDFRCFVLDGQTVALEDYLEVCPEDEPRIRALVASGALVVGPWYVLPDEFLVSAESHVRNLLVGHAVGSRFGPVQKVGYIPDSFGHIAQMPQILRGGEIDSFIYTRGSGAEIDELGFEYAWQAPDGSEVLAVNQCSGYCNASALGFQELWHAHTQREVDVDRAVEQVRELFAKMAERSNGDIYLLNNGCDHFPPQQAFGAVLDALRQAFPETEFVHTDFAAYIDAVREAGFASRRYSGELVSGKLHPILTGVWSARTYLKQMNDCSQSLLAGALEPLEAYFHFVTGDDYPRGQIDYAWKLLLKNHPHDSICGCSIDEVHREMVPRFAGVIETAEQLLRRSMERLVHSFARHPDGDSETVVAVANPLPERRTEVVERLVVLTPLDADTQDLRLYNEDRRAVPFRIIDVKYVERFWGIDYRSELTYDSQREKFKTYLDTFGDRIVRGEDRKEESDRYMVIQFLASNLPACGHTNYYLSDKGAAPARVDVTDPVMIGESATGSGAIREGVAGSELSGDGVIENELVRITLHTDGTFDLLDKETEAQFKGQNRLEDTEDIGDEYDYAPCRESRTIHSAGAAGVVRILEATDLAATLEAESILELPEAIESGRKRRSSRTVTCRVRIRVRLTRGSPLVDVEILFDNRAEDHRLRVEFPSGIQSEKVISDGHFYVNARPLEQPAGSDWVQPPAGTWPQQDFSLIEDGEKGLAVLNRGLPEIAATTDADGVVLSLTLLRAVGWLSRDDFETRRSTNAGPTVHTPDAQCVGEQRFRYAVVPFSGDHVAFGLRSLSQRWRTPVLTKQGIEDGHIPGGVSLLQKDNARAVVTAVKRHEHGDTLIVRLFNETAEEITETLTFGLPVRSAWETNLLEERKDQIAVSGGRQLKLDLGPHVIVTVEVEFAPE